MTRHHVTLSPKGDCVIIALSGRRTEQTAQAALVDVMALMERTKLDRVLLDARDCRSVQSPERTMARALSAGRRLRKCKVAVIADSPEHAYPRIWRKGLEETGHEAMVFTDASAAGTWLFNDAEAETLYLS